MNDTTSKSKILTRWRSDPIWILGVVLGLQAFIVFVAFPVWADLWTAVMDSLSYEFFFIMIIYGSTVIDIVLIFLLCWPIKPNRYIWKSFLLKRKSAPASAGEQDILADFYGRRQNGFKRLGWGLLIGFITNGFAILCAVIHGDITGFTFELPATLIPILLFALVSVFIQCSAEELWIRGILFERLHERCPMWVVIFISGSVFGLLHVFNEGATVLSITGIAVCGIAYALLRWYSGSIWIVMGVHTAWNFTQAFLFGLPNSGIESPASVFYPVTSEGTSNLVYDFIFGVEGALPALFADAAIVVVVLILAARKGRLKELTMNRAKAMEAAA